MVEKIMQENLFESGDRVRHARRPEWGVGSVVRAEAGSQEGRRIQRLAIRFPNAGLKTVLTGHAELELVTGNGVNGAVAAGLERMDESDWLAPIARKKLEETFVELPADARDPFHSQSKRLRIALDLYRFDRSGRGLVDWAVAQSGIDDPLSRYSRQELEQFFDRWATERDTHLGRLLQTLRGEPGLVEEALPAAPAPAQAAVRRFTAQR